MNSKRKRFLCLFLLLIPLVFTPIARAEVLSEETENISHDGFLVSIREEYWEEYLALPKVLSIVAAKQISEDHRLMQFPDLEIVQNWFPEGAIAFYEPNYFMTLLEDPMSPAETTPWNIEMIDMVETRGNLDGQGVRVAIIDTGIKKEHPDFNWAKIETGYNYADNNDNTDDEYGHGTFVAGVIAAIPQNGNLVDGVAPGATIIPLKVIKSDGTILVSWLIQALEAAINEFDCDVVNISLGTQSDSTALRTAIDAVPDHVIIVAAAGNDGTAAYQYPAAYDKVVSVGFVDQYEVVGVKSQKNDQLTLVAPGENIIGLDNTTLFPPNTTTGSGSSYASPHVAGAAALVKEARPDLTSPEFIDAIMQTAKDLGEVGYDTSYGYGLLQIDLLLNKLLTFNITVVMISETEQSKTVQVDFDQMIEGENIEMLIAGYQSSGRLEFLLIRTAIPDTNRNCQILLEIPITVDTDRVKMFLLSSLTSARPIWPCELIFQKA